MCGWGGSSSRENGASSATQMAHSVSRLGLPVPDSSWDSVDLAIPARRATSVSDSPDRWRSRRSEAAMSSSGAFACPAGCPAVAGRLGVRHISSSVRFDERRVGVQNKLHGFDRQNSRARVLRPVDDIALTCLAVLFIGLSYGAIAVASGFPLWVPAAQSVLVLAGASEFLFIGIVAAGGNPIAAALAGLLVNARHLPYGLALPDITGPEVTGRGWRRMAGTHLMNDESVVFALAQDDLPAQAGRLLGLRPRRADLLARRRRPRCADRLRGA